MKLSFHGGLKLLKMDKLCFKFEYIFFYNIYYEIWTPTTLGQAAALVGSHINGWIPSERTIEQTTEIMPLALKQYQLLTSKRMTSLRELHQV